MTPDVLPVGVLEWVAFDIPGGSEPVQLATLWTSEDGARVVLVRFPAGWQRPEAGHYESDEDIVVLEGHLEMSGSTYRAGERVLVPAGYRREATAAPDGALAIARFSGPARWVKHEEETT